MNKSLSDHQASNRTVNESIVRFAVRAKLSDVDERKPRRRRTVPESETPRVKSDNELREEAAWQQVEETGKPVILDSCLLLPNGMSMSQAIEFLPDGIRERTEEAWNAKMSEVWEFIFNSTEKQIREKAEADGKLEWYASLPRSVKHALTESIVRAQWKLPEVPFEELIRKWESPLASAKTKPKPKQKTTRTEKRVKQQPTAKTQSPTDTTGDEPQKVARQTRPPAGLPGDMPVRTTVENQSPRAEDSAIEWNREHHHFLLKRLDQIWGYLNAEEHQAVQELLRRRIGKEEIDQIDEIVKGVEWVRQLQK